MEIAIHRREDGSTILRITRDDGTVTWQKQEGVQARFFPLHDLSHLAVETVLGARSAFYGLIFSGWDIPETDGKHGRGSLPAEALAVEHIVGLLDQESVDGGDQMSLRDFNAQLEMSHASGRLPKAPTLTEGQLDAIRVMRAELHREWSRCSSGYEPMVLKFSVHGAG